jgi:transposase
MSSKYVGMDVHQSTISVAVMDATGRILMECVLRTEAATILQFVQGLRGSIYLTFEEGTWAAWLYDLLEPHVTKIVVCDPRKAALLKAGNKSDKIDARKLADLLRAGLLSAVYHGEASVRTLKELARSYLTLTRDGTRVMSRIKALYRSRALPCAGQKVYSEKYRNQWLEQLGEPGVRKRATWLYQQLDQVAGLRRQARRALLTEAQKHPASRSLRSIPSLGPIRAAILIAIMQTPQRFRTKRQLWAYSGLALETHTSGDYKVVADRVQPANVLRNIGGLNPNHNHDLKYVFMSTAISCSVCPGPFHDFYAGLLTKGARPPMARVTLARKIAAISLILWKKGERFDPAHLKQQAA